MTLYFGRKAINLLKDLENYEGHDFDEFNNYVTLFYSNGKKLKKVYYNYYVAFVKQDKKEFYIKLNKNINAGLYIKNEREFSK